MYDAMVKRLITSMQLCPAESSYRIGPGSSRTQLGVDCVLLSLRAIQKLAELLQLCRLRLHNYLKLPQLCPLRLHDCLQVLALLYHHLSCFAC